MDNRARLAVAAVLLLSSCAIDFNDAIPCTSDEECPRALSCDLDFSRCVGEVERRGGSVPDVLVDVTPDATSDATPDATPDAAMDAPADTPADGVAPDVAEDSRTEVVEDVGSVDAVDTGADAPLDGSGDTACMPQPEVCDAADNDCDGLIDEDGVCDGCGTHAVQVEREDVPAFCIDVYEASRPDATADSEGTDGSRAVSQPGVLPWSNVTIDQASAACEASGRRLCTAVEWVAACQGAEERLYPYGETYQGLACNGANTPPLNGAAPTGSLGECTSPDGTSDQSGNLAEWVSDLSVRGGSFEDPQLNLQCRSRRIPPSSEGPSAAFGFRCCAEP